jgi:rhamnosyltransferase
MTSAIDAESPPPRVLVLLATYNGEPWLREQVDSILSQQAVQVHLEIGDDCSRDGTQALIASAWGDDPRVRLTVWPQGSGSAGANFRRLYRQVDATGFDFVALADQDDVWTPRKLIEAIESLHKHGAQGYSCAVQAFWPQGREQVLDQQATARAADFLFEGAGQGCTFVMRPELFARVRQFCLDHHDASESLHYHDWLIYLLARSWGEIWYFDPRPWMRYRQHGGNEIGSRGSMAAVQRRFDLIRRGWFSGQVRAAAALYRLAGGADPVAQALVTRLLQPSPGLLARSVLARQLALHGRRRASDRAVLVLAALAGWLP